MPWKMNGEAIALKDGNPVWLDGDKEIAADYGHALGKISELTRESVGRKEKLREAEEKLKALEGIENPSEFIPQARKALETVKNLDDKKLIDAGEVEKVKAEVQKVYEAKLAEATKVAAEKDALLNKTLIGGSFARSKYIAEKMAIPADLVEAAFGKNFEIKEGKVIAKGHDGREIYSREKPGDIAEFDEALSILVDGYPNKAAILKGSSASGGGSQGGNGGGSGGAKTMTRAEFEKSDPAARMKFIQDGGKVTD